MIQTTLYIKWLLLIINTNLRPFSLSYYYIDFNVIVSCHWQAKTKIDTAFYITTNNIVFLKFVKNHGGDETVTDLYIIMVYILFTQFNIRNAVSKGRYISHYGAFKFTVPTMYQCAELCQVLDVCQSITFDKSLQQCKLNSITWNVETLTPNSSFIYAEKTNIPVVNIFRVCFCFCFLFCLFFFWIYVHVHQCE